MADEGHEDSWAPEAHEIARRRRLALQLGGPEAIARQHAAGKLDARQRIHCLLDVDSFREIGRLTGTPISPDGFLPTNHIIGTGRIGGRGVVVTADDYTIRGGSSDGSIYEKLIYAERLAFESERPLVRLIDSGGAPFAPTNRQAGPSRRPPPTGRGPFATLQRSRSCRWGSAQRPDLPRREWWRVTTP